MTDCQNFSSWSLPTPKVGRASCRARGHLGCGMTAQNVDHMPGTVALTGTVDGRQELLSRLRAVDGLDRVEARIAIAAPAPARLAEMGQEGLASASDRLADAQECAELGPFDPLDRLGRFAAVDHLPPPDEVAHPVGHPGVGWQAVSPGPAGLLIIGLDRTRQIEMRHVAGHRACRSPCRRRRLPRDRGSPPSGRHPGWRPARPDRARRGRAAPGRRWRTGTPPSPPRSCGSGSRRCRSRPNALSRTAATGGGASPSRRSCSGCSDDRNSSRRPVRSRARGGRAGRRGSADPRWPSTRIRGMPGNLSLRIDSLRYSGRKSWPQAETQWASSMAKSEIVPVPRWSRNPSIIRRSGAT